MKRHLSAYAAGSLTLLTTALDTSVLSRWRKSMWLDFLSVVTGAGKGASSRLSST